MSRVEVEEMSIQPPKKLALGLPDSSKGEAMSQDKINNTSMFGLVHGKLHGFP